MKSFLLLLAGILFAPLAHAQTIYATPYTFTTLAGAPGVAGAVNGTGADARFNNPIGIAADSAGNVYVAEESTHAIRKITPAGVVTTFAGALGVVGNATGTVATARFFGPTDLVFDSAGNLYVADRGNMVIRKITPSGNVTTFAGAPSASGNIDGTGINARFSFPARLAIDRSDTIYVTDQHNNLIRKISPAGVVTTVAGGGPNNAGSADGVGSAARFDLPLGIAVDGNGNLYIADTGNETIRKITPAGVVSTFAGLARAQGTADGPGSVARFLGPTGVTVDSAGNVFVADGNHTIRRITPAGEVTTVAGSPRLRGSADGTGAVARFNLPHGLVFDAAGKLYVADRFNHTIRVGTPAGAALAFTTQPVSQTAVPGANVTFTAIASGAGTITYQWQKDNAAIPGATTTTLSVSNVQPSNLGSYTLVAATATESATSNAAILSFNASAAARLVNLSILTSLAGASDSFTMGYVVGGSGTSGTKPLVIRAAGPSLAQLGVGGALTDPQLTLFTGATQSGANDNWGGGTPLFNAMEAVGAFRFTGPTSLDAAVATNVAAGDNSVKVSPVGNLSGAVIAEIYDATPNASFTAATPRLVNVSVLKNIGTSLTAGFVIGGTGSRTVLIRAIGPTLGAAPFNVPGVVADPQLVLFNGAGAKVGENDNWGGTAALSAAFTAVGAFQLSGPTSRDAALLAPLTPGNYTVQVSGVGGTTGTALVEVYEVP